MPGWFKGSWAYHGDDGLLFVEGDYRSPSPDFGARGQFGAGDTAGVYLNLETGEAFCTRNGRMMKMGEFCVFLPFYNLSNMSLVSGLLGSTRDLTNPVP